MANPHAGLIPYPSPTIGNIVPKMKGRADLSGEMSEIVGTPQLPSGETKACDICKLRKVRCQDGQPCRACRVHTSPCVFSQRTRTQLLKLSKSPGREAQSERQYIARRSLERTLLPTTSRHMTPLEVPQTNNKQVVSRDVQDEAFRMSGLIENPTSVDWSGMRWTPNGFRLLVPALPENPKPATTLSNQLVDIRIQRLSRDPFGNAGIILSQTDASGRIKMEYWGMTSYIGIQDVLARMLHAKVARSPLGFATLPFTRRRGSTPDFSSVGLWRWGCDTYISRDRLNTQDLAAPDPMFLPREIAHRFLASYVDIIHPLFPVLHVRQLSQSIHETYAFGSSPHARVTQQSWLERARNMLVLAFGAQVIAGDGDVDCPRDVATVWSETLRRNALDIMKAQDVLGGGVDLIRLWIVYAAFSRSYGNSDDELSAMHTAARSITRLGLHRKGAHEAFNDHSNDLARLFAVCFYSEKWACLCHGSPSSLSWNQETSEIIAEVASDPDTIKLTELGRLMDAAQDLFDDLPNVSMGQGLFQAQGLHSKLIAFRESLDHRYDAFALSNAHPDTAAHETTTKDTFLQLTIYGLYLQLKTLVLLPSLQVATWRALGHASMLKSSEVVDGMARQCVDAALSTIRMFERHIASFPETPELSLSCIFLLYAISAIYMDILRTKPEEASNRWTQTVRLALRILERYSHPAATLAEAMCEDLLCNFLNAGTTRSTTVPKTRVD